MSVDIEIPSVFGKYSNNKLDFKVEARTVGEALHELGKQSPGLKKLLFEKEDKLSRAFDIFVNGESAYPETLTKPVKDGDKLNIVMLIYGG
jgi:molybdopterin converting factor small subunit